MKRFATLSAAAGAALGGLGAAIFLLPRSGLRRRRAAAAAARRQSANVATLVSSSVAGGAMRRGRGDAQLAEAVRAELRRRFDSAADSIQVTSQRGTVTLRGEVTRLADIAEFDEAARVAGAGEVNNLLRLPVAQAETPPLRSAQ